MISKEYCNDDGEIKYIIMSKWYNNQINKSTKDSIICMTFNDLAKIFLNNNKEALNNILLDYIEFNENINEDKETNFFIKDNVLKRQSLKKHYFHLLDKSNGCCFYCGIEINNNIGEIEHKYPLSRGGTNQLENLIISCKKCNLEKNTKTVEEYRQYLINKKKHCGIFYGESL